MSWFHKLLPFTNTKTDQKRGVPEGLWSMCEPCGAVLFFKDLEANQNVCPKCGHHGRISARKRINTFIDAESGIEIASAEATDHLKFRDSKRYKDRLATAQKETGEKDALLVFRGRLKGMPLVVAAFEFSFIGGSMGAAVGENFVRAVNTCLEYHTPLVCFSASGGARMQEGLISLMQMAKTSAALAKLSQARLPFISVLTDPTMGGVSASLAMLGDLIVAEPNALVGFAGPRVIEQTVRAVLPEGFQRSEFLLQHGSIDMIIDRREMRDRVAALLAKLMHQSLLTEKTEDI